MAVAAPCGPATALLVLLALQAAGEPVQLPLGAALPLTGQIAIPGRGFLRAFEVAVEQLNEDLALASASYRFQRLPVCDTETSTLKGADCALAFGDFCGSGKPRPVGILGAGFSSVTLQMLPVTTRFKLLQCSPLSSSTDLSAARSYPFFFRSAPPDDKRAVAILATAQHFGWARAVVSYTTDRYGKTNGEQVLARAPDFGFAAQSLTVATLPPSFSQLAGAALQEVEVAVLRKIRLSQARVVVHFSLLADSEAFLRMAKRGGVLGPGWAYVGADAWANWATPSKLAELDEGTLGFTRQDLTGSLLVVAQEEETETTARFRAGYLQKYNSTQLEPFALAGYDCVRAMGLAVAALLAANASLSPAALLSPRLDSGIQEQLAAAAMSLEFEGAGGAVQFAKPGAADAGDRVPRYAVSSWQAGSWELKATFDENRRPAFLPLGDVIFSNGEASLSAEAPGCPPGSEADPEAEIFAGQACRSCPEGRYRARASDGACAECQAGFRCPAGSTKMEPCQPGNFSGAGQSHCLLCPKGRASAGATASVCGECPAGFHQAREGQVRCEPCVIGRFQPAVGRSSCEACNASFSTEGPGTSAAEMCGCSKGTYFVSARRSCVACGEGVACTAFDAPPLVAPRYFMYAEAPRDVEPLDIFKCMSAEACKGEKARGDDMCAGGLHGLNCGRCPMDQYPSSASSCSSCGDLGWLSLPGFVVAVLVLSGPFHLLWNHGRAESVELAEGVVCSTTLGVSLVFLQSLGLMGSFSVRWPDAFQLLLNILKIILFDLTAVQPMCAVGETLLTSYGLRLALPMLFAATFAGWFFFSQLLHAATRGYFPKFHVADVLNSLGMVIQAVYISVVATTFLVLDCYGSPNGKRTIRSIPYAECSGPEYLAIMPVFSAAVLFYVVGLTGTCAYCLKVAPKYYASPHFRAATRFLIFKFQPEKWWFGLVVLARSFLLAMITVAFPDDAFLQVLTVAAIVTAFLCYHLLCMPYADRYANDLETLELVVLLAINAVGTWFLTPRDLTSPMARGLAFLMVGMVGVSGLGLLACFTWGLYLASKPKGLTERREKQVEKLIADYMLVCTALRYQPPKRFKALILKCSYIDHWHITEATRMMKLEFCGLQGTKLSDQRLPLLISQCSSLKEHEADENTDKDEAGVAPKQADDEGLPPADLEPSLVVRMSL